MNRTSMITKIAETIKTEFSDKAPYDDNKPQWLLSRRPHMVDEAIIKNEIGTPYQITPEITAIDYNIGNESAMEKASHYHYLNITKSYTYTKNKGKPSEQTRTVENKHYDYINKIVEKIVPKIKSQIGAIEVIGPNQE